MDSPTPADIAAEAWRLWPDTFAARMSEGRWRRFAWLSYLGRRVGDGIRRGGYRAIVSAPPRHGKSQFLSLWVPLWLLDWRPDARVILTSYEADVAAGWGRQVRDHRAALLGPDSVREDVSAVSRWETPQGGGMATAGVGGPITGKGADLLLCDDPVKNAEQAESETYRRRAVEWWQSTFRTRAEPGASIILLMTRWHEMDLAGALIDEGAEPWDVIRLPALAEDDDPLGRSIGQALCPERYDEAALQALTTSVGSKVWASLFQQRPAPIEGAEIKRAWLENRYDVLPDEALQRGEWIQSWDLKAGSKEPGSSFAVGQLWCRFGARCYLVDQVRGRWDVVETLAQMRGVLRDSPLWKRATRKLVEDKADGRGVVAMLEREIPGLCLRKADVAKVVRIRRVAPLFEAGNVWLPRQAPWLGAYVQELSTVPGAANDDQADATAQALSEWVGVPARPVAGSRTLADTRRRPSDLDRMRKV